MPSTVNYGDVGVLKTLALNLSRTATLTGTGVDLQGLDGEAVVIQSAGAATSGSSPTLDGKLQDSADNSTGWADITGAVFTQVTTTASDQKISINVSEVKRYVRYVGTIGGTSTPTFPFSCNLIGSSKYPA